MDHVKLMESDEFVLHLDMCLYNRAAVLKVLNRWTSQYAINLSRTSKDTIEIVFDPLQDVSSDKKIDSQKIHNELIHEMLRLEIIAQTSNVRELLVGRALYATCIEVDKASSDTSPANTEQTWQEDCRRILASWSSDR